jgi:uncharacterized membrane protein
LRDAAWPVGALLVLATASTLVSQIRSLQFQNIAVVAAIILALASGILFLNAKTEIPFGPIIFTKKCGAQLFDALPPALPLLWLVAILNCRGVARLILRPWRKTRTYGFRVIGLTCALATLFDFALEPFATRANHFWLWRISSGVNNPFGSPWVNFFGWAVTTLFILVVITPWLINKMPGKRPPDFHPLALWFTLNIFLAANLATHQLWLPTAIALAVCATVGGFVWKNR